MILLFARTTKLPQKPSPQSTAAYLVRDLDPSLPIYYIQQSPPKNPLWAHNATPMLATIYFWVNHFSFAFVYPR
jgi:hypothetical protein